MRPFRRDQPPTEASDEPEITGGGYGLISPIPDVFGYQFTPTAAIFTSVVCASICVVCVWFLTKAPTGAAWRTMKHSEPLAQSVGMPLRKLKTSAFAFSAALASLAGVLYVFLLQSVTPEAFGIFDSVDHLCFLVLGGMGSVAGSVIGPVVLELIPEAMRPLVRYRDLFTGLALLLILIVAPRGIAGIFGSLTHWVRPRLRQVASKRPGGPIGQISKWSAAVSERGEAAPEVPPSIARQSTGSTGVTGPLLEFDAVDVQFGGLRAVDDLSFTVEIGEVHGLIGPNGAGKTTAINALTQFVMTSSGQIRLAGEPLLAADRKTLRPHMLAAAGVSRTFQTPIAVPTLTAVENVMVGLHRHLETPMVAQLVDSRSVAGRRSWARGRALELLSDLRFTADPDGPVDGLSLGQLRQIELARALAQQPRLLLLDEPTSGLEAHVAADTITLIGQLQEVGDRPLTVLLVEHNVPLVFGHCDRVTVMTNGHAIISDTPDVVRQDTRVKDAYLGYSARGGDLDSASVH